MNQVFLLLLINVLLFFLFFHYLIIYRIVHSMILFYNYLIIVLIYVYFFYQNILNNHVSNLDIVKLKPNVIGTARGTIGMEMAYFSIPVVALYDNIYINYNFVHNANTKEEFYKVLKGEMLPNCNFDKELIYKFYYQLCNLGYLEKV